MHDFYADVIVWGRGCMVENTVNSTKGVTHVDLRTTKEGCSAGCSCTWYVTTVSHTKHRYPQPAPCFFRFFPPLLAHFLTFSCLSSLSFLHPSVEGLTKVTTDSN